MFHVNGNGVYIFFYRDRGILFKAALHKITKWLNYIQESHFLGVIVVSHVRSISIEHTKND